MFLSKNISKFSFCLLLLCLAANAQIQLREFTVAKNPRIEIENRFGQVRVLADEVLTNKVLLEITAPKSSGAINEKEIAVQATPDKITLTVNQTQKRVDLTLRVPIRSRLKVIGADGAIEISGNFALAEVSTDTGTIYADVPTDSLKFDFLWTESRPRYVSDFEIPAPKEKAGGKFETSGKIPNQKSGQSKSRNPALEVNSGELDADADHKNKKQKIEDTQVSLNLITKRGVILLNVPPSQVPSDLRERPLTNAAKAVVRSGDSILSAAIRRASPKYFGDYLKNLPDRRLTPSIISREPSEKSPSQADLLQRVTLSVADRNGRAINNLKAADFALFENGEARETVNLEPTIAPFNLVLLLDVSGSVEERIDFIRKAARNFVRAVGANDKLAIITFRDDVQVVSSFTTDKNLLSKSLDTFDAGGGTALYDSLAYVLADTLRPLKGERTAIVILSDGDDNRSFIPFELLLGAIQESGALVYPLYVPSGLIPQNGQPISSELLDPLRTRFLTLTTKAETEAKQLAEVSGGVYFPIRRLEDLQKAYDDVIAQLRTAYNLTYRSKSAAAPRLRISIKRADAFVRIISIFEIK